MKEHSLITQDEIIYVSDLQTFDLLYLNANGQKLLWPGEGIGSKCYAALHGRTSPCTFCNLSSLKKDETFVCHREKAYFDNSYVIQNRIIQWYKRSARLEIASRLSNEFVVFQNIVQKLAAWARLGEVIRGGGGENAFCFITDDILRFAGIYYQAESAFLFLYEADKSISLISEWSESANQKLNLEINGRRIALWQEQLGLNRAVFVPDKQAVCKLLETEAGENMLGVLQGQADGSRLLMLLCNIKAYEESYGFLETAGYALYSELLYNRQEEFCQPQPEGENPLPVRYPIGFEREAVYYEALMASCEYICDVDLVTDTYQFVSYPQSKELPFSQGESYDAFVAELASQQIHPEDQEVFFAHLSLSRLKQAFCEDNKQRMQFAYRKLIADGQYVWKNDVILYREGPEERDKTVIIISYNIDEQKQDEQQKLNHYLSRQEQKYRRESRHKDEIYRIIGEQTKVRAFEWSRDFEQDSGFSLTYINQELAEEFHFFRTDIHLFTHLLTTNRIHKLDLNSFCEFLEDDTKQSSEIVCRITLDGYDYIWYQLTKRIILNEAELEERMIGTVLNVDEETRANQMLKRRARLDSLTGLLNQEAFYVEAERLITSNPEVEYAVIIMDIDNFKLINSLYGMNVGNQVLAQIGQTLQSCIGKHDVCARVYADVYYMVTVYQNGDTMVNLIEKMMERLTYVEYGAMLLPCFGISNSKNSERSITLLCELASFAHKYSKGHARERYTFYDSSIRQTIIEEKQMESEMEFALHNGQFKVYLQPKYIISSRKVIGAEALVRWEHPTKGMIVPGKFISLFEKNGFILRLDEYIWEQVCILLNKWQTSGSKCIPISVNMSRLHLNNRDFKTTIVNMLQKYHINHKWFELELTENLLFDNLNQMISVLSDLQHQGFYINMDDFGSGYSSLNLLRNIPIDILKIDGNFFDEKMMTPKGKTIVKYVVSMAKELNMQVVAEGVENLSQEKFLLEVGCEIAQGFYFSKPLSIAAFESKYWHTM